MTLAADPLIGTELLGYRIDALIGRGGMGVVYRAYDLRLKRNVALKLVASGLSRDERFRARFMTETELAASLEHPNVVPIHDAGEYDGQLYLTMRHVQGSDLKVRLREEGTLPPARAIAICSQVAAALDAAQPMDSYIATSSPPTSCSTPRSTSTSRTSASRGGAQSRHRPWRRRSHWAHPPTSLLSRSRATRPTGVRTSTRSAASSTRA